jgi:hypothetical protein
MNVCTKQRTALCRNSEAGIAIAGGKKYILEAAAISFPGLERHHFIVVDMALHLSPAA